MNARTPRHSPCYGPPPVAGPVPDRVAPAAYQSPTRGHARFIPASASVGCVARCAQASPPPPTVPHLRPSARSCPMLPAIQASIVSPSIISARARASPISRGEELRAESGTQPDLDEGLRELRAAGREHDVARQGMTCTGDHRDTVSPHRPPAMAPPAAGARTDGAAQRPRQDRPAQASPPVQAPGPNRTPCPHRSARSAPARPVSSACHAARAATRAASLPCRCVQLLSAGSSPACASHPESLDANLVAGAPASRSDHDPKPRSGRGVSSSMQMNSGEVVPVRIVGIRTRRPASTSAPPALRSGSVDRSAVSAPLAAAPQPTRTPRQRHIERDVQPQAQWRCADRPQTEHRLVDDGAQKNATLRAAMRCASGKPRTSR